MPYYTNCCRRTRHPLFNVINLPSSKTYYDVAVRDFALSLASLGPARLSTEFDFGEGAYEESE